MAKIFPVVRRVQKGGGGGGDVPPGAAVMTDAMETLEIIGDETNAAQADSASFEIEAQYSETNAAQQETASFGFSGFMESNAPQSETLSDAIRRYATATRGGGTNPGNATGPEDGQTAQVKAGGILFGSERMEVVIEPPLSGAGSAPTIKCFYAVNGGLLDGAAASVYYYQPTTDGGDQPITFVDWAGNEGTTNAETAVTIPTSVVAGDLLIASLRSTSRSNASTVIPSGWTRYGTRGFTTNGISEVQYKIADGSEAGTAVEFFSTGIGGKGLAGITANEATVAVFRGADAANPIEDDAATVYTASNGPRTQPSVTTTGNNRLVVYINSVGGANPATGNPTSGAYSVGAVPRVTHGAAGGSQSLGAAFIASEHIDTPGTAPNRTFTIADAGSAAQGDASLSVALALKPAVADGTPAISLIDLPRSGNYLSTPFSTVLQGIGTTEEIFFRFEHGAIVPLLGGSIDIDAVSLDSEDVL